MKKRYWRGNNGAKRKKLQQRWASFRSGYPEDGGKMVFRWGEGLGCSQKVVLSEEIAEMLAQQWIKFDFEEIPQ